MADLIGLSGFTPSALNIDDFMPDNGWYGGPDLIKPEGRKPVEPDQIKKTCSKILSKMEPCGGFDYSCLPPILAGYTEDLIKNSEYHPITAIQSILCTISALIGKKAKISYPNYHTTLHANLWCLTINPSGNFKTTILNNGTEIATEMFAGVRDEIENVNTRISELAFNNDKESKKAIAQLRQELAELEGYSPYLPLDGSVEGFIDSLRYSNGGMIKASEFSSFMKNLAKGGNESFKAKLTDIYDCPQYLQPYRTRGGGVIPMPKYPFVTINTMSTLEWDKSEVSQEDSLSGFLARFLIFYPPQKRIKGSALPMGSKRDHDIKDEIKRILSDMREVEYVFSEESGKLFTEIYDATWAEIEKLEDRAIKIILPFFRRWMTGIPKIAMLLEPFQTVEPGGGVHVEISERSISAAWKIIEYAMKGTVYLLQNELGESDFQKSVRLVKEFIALKKGRVKRQTLLSSHTLEGGSKEYDEIIQFLSESGTIDIESGTGKKNDVYFLI